MNKYKQFYKLYTGPLPKEYFDLKIPFVFQLVFLLNENSDFNLAQLPLTPIATKVGGWE